MTILEENQFYAKMSKCTLGKEEVEYLGSRPHNFKERVKVASKQVKVIIEWPKPKCV